MQTLRYVVADVFTDRPLAGNQLAVFTDARGVDDATMQALALEIGFSETAFVLPPEQGGQARVRIFNPRHEMRFAGHPVLGTAWVLAIPLQRVVVELETGVGIVPVEIERDTSGAPTTAWMRQPVPSVQAVADADALLDVLGLVRSELPVEVYDNGATHIVVTLENEEAVASLAAPDPTAIARFGVTGVNCVAGSGERWKTRMFWPLGEDPATGSAAGPIACHLCRHGKAAWGARLTLVQGVEIGRPSTLLATARGSDAGVEEIEVGGSAIVVARGEFRIG